jgi:hypothetical protein
MQPYGKCDGLKEVVTLQVRLQRPGEGTLQPYLPRAGVCIFQHQAGGHLNDGNFCGHDGRGYCYTHAHLAVSKRYPPYGRDEATKMAAFL